MSAAGGQPKPHRWDVPANFSIADACCGRWAPDRTRFALYWEDESGETAAFTYWDIERQANRLANALSAMGVARGDKVALILPQRPETVVAHIAINRLGAVAVPLSFLFGPEALEYRLQDSEAKVAFVDPQSLPNMTAIRERCAGIAHIIGVAGAHESWVVSWEATLAHQSPHFTPPQIVATPSAVLTMTFIEPSVWPPAASQISPGINSVGPEISRSRKRMSDMRSRIRYSVRSSERLCSDRSTTILNFRIVS